MLGQLGVKSAREDGRPLCPVSACRTVFVSDASDSLLERIYSGLIVPSFPYEDRDDFEVIQKFIRNSENSGAVRAAFRAIALLEGSQIAGATLYGVIDCDGLRFMVGQYTVVSAPYRGRGLGSYLSNIRESEAAGYVTMLGSNGLDFSVVTLSNSTHCESRDSMWRGLGYQRIDFPYIQLPLHDGLPPLTGVHIRFKGMNERFRRRKQLWAREMRAILRGCTHFRINPEINESVPEYNAMLQALSGDAHVNILDE